MVFAARLTQRGHRIASMADLERLYEQPYCVHLSTINLQSHSHIAVYLCLSKSVE
jgi:hypothetical protein